VKTEETGIISLRRGQIDDDPLIPEHIRKESMGKFYFILEIRTPQTTRSMNWIQDLPDVDVDRVLRPRLAAL